MQNLLAYADSSDSSGTNLVLVMGDLFIVVATAALTLILISLARVRRHRRAEVITVAAIFWALLTAGSLLYAVQQRVDWTKNHDLQIKTGYLDPRDISDKPQLPWAIWTELGAGYAAMLAWTVFPKR